ncbi:MAG: PD-(D/E)XK nuclease family protein [Pirellulaceae bacterium]
MQINRVFLDWTRPALPNAAEYLINRFARRRICDLTDVVVVVPGGRAGRRLREWLVTLCTDRNLSLFPPDITTTGQFPELLYTAKQAFANSLTQQLAWAKALQQTSTDDLKLIMKDVPDRTDDPRWTELGALLQKQHRELAGEGLDFQQVVQIGSLLESFDEAARWTALSHVQAAYLQILNQLQLWDRQTARLYAIQHRECQADKQIVLVGAADMNSAMRQMLDQVADKVTALIVAPERFQNRFDSHGCIVPQVWQNVYVPLDEQHVLRADRPADQAQAVVHAIGQSKGQYSAEEITIGFPNESLVAQVQRQLKQCSLEGRWGPGTSIEATRPIQLLRCVIDLLQRKRFAQYAEFLRHPDVYHLLKQKGIEPISFLKHLDRYQTEYVPQTLDGRWPERLTDSSTNSENVASSTARSSTLNVLMQVYDFTAELLSPLQASDRKPLEWAEPILQFLHSVYGEFVVSVDDAQESKTLFACDCIRQTLEDFSHLPDQLAPKVSADQALLMVLSQISSQLIPAPLNADSIEMLGWLELPLDDAQCTILTYFNDGYVPAAIGSDLFLPNQLRSQLGLEDSDRMYARDTYALTALLQTKEFVRVIVGRHTDQGDPLTPSRLLFATDDEAIVRRALASFDDDQDPVEWNLPQRIPQLEQHRFEVPAPQAADEVSSLSVTDFRAYLACPYRFYLNRVLRLGPLRDDAAELGANSFGTFLHEVLDAFGQSVDRDSSDEITISNCLNDLLNESAQRWAMDRARPAVQVQLEQARHRLAKFAQAQAKRRREGWIIEASEFNVEDSVIHVDGERFTLKGRIDRIDRHEFTGKLAVLDYKTGDGGKCPEKAHRQADEWIDLQLPLYRHLLSQAYANQPTELGYVVLPKSAESKFLMAPWSAADFESADEVMYTIIRKIRDRQFWPPTTPPPAFSEDFAAICQDSVFDRQLAHVSVDDASSGGF